MLKKYIFIYLYVYILSMFILHTHIHLFDYITEYTNVRYPCYGIPTNMYWFGHWMNDEFTFRIYKEAGIK